MATESERRWNPDRYHAIALENLIGLTDTDAKTWYNHPCTKYLINSLTGDQAALVQGWISGRFTDKSLEATAQENAKRIGQVQNIDDLLEQIELLGKNRIKGEENNDSTVGAYSPS